MIENLKSVGFEYKGRQYIYESEETYDLIPTGEFDENGEEITEENTNENVNRLLQWILSEEGQYIITETGYVGVSK